MGIIISLQGGMAVGKSTLAKYLSSHYENLFVSYEDISHPLQVIRSRNLDKNVFEDYIEIQKIFIEHEIQRYQSFKRHDLVLVDLGPDEVEFYTLNYPKSIGMDWNVAKALEDELEALRQCHLDGVIYLDASKESLTKRKFGDIIRNRSFFDHYIERLHDVKRAWFMTKPNVQVIVTDGLTPEAVGEIALEYLRTF